MNLSLPEGDHVVTVQIPGTGWSGDTRTVTITAGNNDLSVTLLPLVTGGPQRPPGAHGINGTSVSFVDYFSGTTYLGAATGCPNGGAVYAAGSPPVTAYVCNGVNGTNGIDGTNGAGARAAGPWVLAGGLAIGDGEQVVHDDCACDRAGVRGCQRSFADERCRDRMLR
jgi:hypothetical protein